jgi:hypothetical protein
MLYMFHTYVATTVCLKRFICSNFCCSKCFYVASCKCSIWMLHMFSHICCKCMFQMFHLFQTYVAFKCFMLHVFYAVRRVRGAQGSDGGTTQALGNGVLRAGGWWTCRASCWGQWSRARRGRVWLRGGANGWGRGERMEAGRIKAGRADCERVVQT